MEQGKENIGMKMAILIAFCVMLFGEIGSAAVLWMGGEDIDFPNGTAASCSGTSGGWYRSAYARGQVGSCGTASSISTSRVFPGGAITSGWLSARIYNAYSNTKYVGFGKVGTSNILMFGTDSADASKPALWKYNGTTWTQIASGAAGAFSTSSLHKVDLQVISYGASATVNIYINAAVSAAVTYSGDVTAGGNTNLDGVALGYMQGQALVSEIIVADSDTRLLSLATLAPNAAGDANAWTGAYTDVNTVSINDTTYVSNNTSGDDFQCNLSALPTGNFQVLSTKIVARATKTASGLTSVAVGVKTNATVNTPAAVAQQASWTTNETYYSTNPVTATNWTTTDINALQINLRSAP